MNNPVSRRHASIIHIFLSSVRMSWLHLNSSPLIIFPFIFHHSGEDVGQKNTKESRISCMHRLSYSQPLPFYRAQAVLLHNWFSIILTKQKAIFIKRLLCFEKRHSSKDSLLPQTSDFSSQNFRAHDGYVLWILNGISRRLLICKNSICNEWLGSRLKQNPLCICANSGNN